MGPHRDGLVELVSRTAPRLRELRADIHRSPSSEQSQAPRIPSPRGLCSVLVVPARLRALPALVLMIADGGAHLAHRRAPGQKSPPGLTGMLRGRGEDRKSTRLNSSHVAISYAVFCLKKKQTAQAVDTPDTT